MSSIKIPIYCIYQSIRHPLSTIVVCTNPSRRELSPMPWWGSIGIIIIGVATWCMAAKYQIQGMDEAARLMVYVPLGNILGMSIAINNVKSVKVITPKGE